MSQDGFPTPELVPVPLGCVSTRLAIDALFDRLYPGKLERGPTRKKRHRFQEHVEIATRKVREALHVGKLKAFATVNGQRMEVPSAYWCSNRSLNLRGGRLIVTSDDLKSWRVLHEQICFLDREAFKAWLAAVERQQTIVKRVASGDIAEAFTGYVAECNARGVAPNRKQNQEDMAARGFQAKRDTIRALRKDLAPHWTSKGRRPAQQETGKK